MGKGDKNSLALHGAPEEHCPSPIRMIAHPIVGLWDIKSSLDNGH